ncbi:di-trans,poly-cis-decaprenylcistransferase [Candidatus Uhrbacteria bacterium RIFCSPHIGHO2_01_FULL_63_20]|uniref:Isoprenyl transferase n=1 Tax=Candidatus Uhrbacteria bacterium RIFCSPHIGHO2_01_FULL_63_20 TaxID=1802385 RepID=A0A1F7TMK0_9BACT|nr:MAG: di-trans,poly-cis-decaprenylcistransferase [Candidatus Uhrbacteria bacterium RIFCSPHIGHO2_01_FULL_63_20]
MPDDQTPRHVAIIPDGNRRWAKRHGLKPWEGHDAGARRFRPILRAAFEEGVYCVSAWIASRSNLTTRSKVEVEFLYQVLERFFLELTEVPELSEHGVRVQVFGQWREFQPPGLVKAIEGVIEKTKRNDRHPLNFFDAYDGVSEMTDAIQRMVDEGRKDPRFAVEPSIIKRHLLTKDLPPVDLVIRTGGEPHWSGGFMMWDIAEAQFHFSDKMFPDFGAEDFRAALEEYRSRERRQGK